MSNPFGGVLTSRLNHTHHSNIGVQLTYVYVLGHFTLMPFLSRCESLHNVNRMSVHKAYRGGGQTRGEEEWKH
jgi:hypothetical protein